MSLKLSKEAVFARINGDATIMAILGQAPYPDRLPKGAIFSTTKVAMVIDGASIREAGAKEAQTITLHLYSQSHDRAAQAVDQLYVLFDSKYWKELVVGAGKKAMSIIEFETDANDPDAEFIHKIVRLNVRFAAL